MTVEVPLPQPGTIFRAIDIYLRHAYAPRGEPPRAVQARLLQLHQSEGGEFFACPAFEHQGERRMVRLGNSFYPHMKMSVEPRPDKRGWLFRADTHDRHVLAGVSGKEAELFRELVEKNRALGQAIEAAWAEAGIPTFRTFLKDDLARRAAAESGEQQA